MAAVYEDNFGYYDLEATPTKRRFSPSSRARASQVSWTPDLGPLAKV
jgi:hypothetical protein